MEKSYTLFELNQYLRRVLALNFSEALWLRCEVAQCGESGGHLFLDLVEKAEDGDGIIARAEGVVWKSARRRIEKKHPLRRILAEGNEVFAKARVDYHERYGIKLVIEEVDADFTLGRLLLRRMETLERLKKAGLLHQNRGLDLPAVIQRVAVVSSESAAGWQDYRQQIKENPYGYDIRASLFATTMQGDHAAAGIAKRLRQIAASGMFDCVAIIRGGGARLDLAAFDDHALGKAIAHCPLPVLTGIGHDVDETVADHVAHSPLKTPTAVADFIIQHNARFEGGLERAAMMIQRSALSTVREGEVRLLQQRRHLAFAANQTCLSARQKTNNISNNFSYQIQNYFNKKWQLLDNESHLIKALDVQTTLERGYALVSKEGRRLSSENEVLKGDELLLRFKDGEIKVKVI